MSINQWYVLYCLIYNYEKRYDIIALLLPDYFHDDLARKLYDYIVDLNSKNIVVDITLIKSKFEAEFQQIEETFSSLDIDLNLYEEYITNLRSVYVTNQIKNLGEMIQRAGDINEEKFIGYTDALLNKISGSKESEICYSSELVDDFIGTIDSENELDGLSTGIEDLDKHLGGLKNEDYILCAARPSMGKSGLLGYVCMSNAMAGIPTLMFSLEMPGKAFVGRMFGAACDIELWKFKKKKFRTQEDHDRFEHTKGIFKSMPLAIDNSAVLDIQKMRSVIQKVKLKYPNLGLIGIDYMQLMSGVGDGDNAVLSKISKNLKGIAKTYKVPVIACSQLSRKCEERDNKRPILSDLRDSGALEQDADIVIMMYRDSYYTTNPEHERICELLIRKYRNGETGKVVVDYNRKTQAFKSIRPDTKLWKASQQFMYE